MRLEHWFNVVLVYVIWSLDHISNYSHAMFDENVLGVEKTFLTCCAYSLNIIYYSS